ncbi:rod shape-determining protein MreD [Anaerotardibacter muris]|uniref:rod shape-determining protein MreD n=1 Tax=Anaerotardibacter muris TaxID=2941505 RepID=UPI00203C6B5A|nr:rod shape-determining protein MreD [Anaerotardibacter muris]
MRDKLIPLISAAIVVLLQIVLAPVISIYSVVPNFIVSFVIVLSIVRREDTTYLYAFVMGIISDLLSHVPLGLTPLLLLLISFALSRVFEILDKSSFAMVLVSSAVAVLVYELVVMIVQLVMGYPASFFDMLVARVLPATVFNFIICAILYFVARKFPDTPSGNDAWTVDDSQRFR